MSIDNWLISIINPCNASHNSQYIYTVYIECRESAPCDPDSQDDELDN